MSDSPLHAVSLLREEVLQRSSDLYIMRYDHDKTTMLGLRKLRFDECAACDVFLHDPCQVYPLTAIALVKKTFIAPMQPRLEQIRQNHRFLDLDSARWQLSSKYSFCAASIWSGNNFYYLRGAFSNAVSATDMKDQLVLLSYANPFGNAALLIIGACLALVCFTRAYTTVAYHRAIKTEHGVVHSPVLPYSIPWFGHTLRFLDKDAQRWYPKHVLAPPHDVFSLMVGGRRTIIVTNAAATRHLFRHTYSGGLTRENFVGDLLGKCLLVSPNDISVINTGEGRKAQEEVFLRYLSRREDVRELTRLYSERLAMSYESIPDDKDTSRNVHLYAWLREHIMKSSLATFFGDHLLHVCPDLCTDIFHFDEDLCSFFFATPRILNRDAWTRRERMLRKLMEWDAMIYNLNGGPPAEPTDAPSWDPIFGSRFNKARLRFYDQYNLSAPSRAGMNLSIMFALASNVIPSIMWMLSHILAGADSPRLLTAIRQEISSATTPDDTLDLSLLLSSPSTSPILHSIWTEVLRSYCDNMIMRDVISNTTIPLDDQGLKKLDARKGDLVIAPCWVPHHDSRNWEGKEASPANDFIADRFTRGDNLSHVALAGVPTPQMFPFGGGKSICAGRIFAREEALVTVAQTLKILDFEVKGFLDEDGKSTTSFPGVTPSLPGVVIYAPNGDLRVEIKRRRS
ncbi:hypothetical protein AC579_640 [Pseudocercospora musae]|uniref:Cytochrome P450 n=1 Tax=Pseudocercospora musae TaxID=113226 RepID=A0A139I915_9PEZI|nr:hypothetical protein AC579_640 [Pseudocercospora musae]KXT11123.1 hypothetical protein AC579_640 [Pseudocercospora musae]KXT11126.1 hypothetical protein AC579_640 [Pseudocercospora musae]KXT11128.1 hypothetical protein AC579_640 [Pseudocercospora musae]KXT11129.1 hypothetical protein AC579_640 [Pseudocercospora musae]